MPKRNVKEKLLALVDGHAAISASQLAAAAHVSRQAAHYHLRKAVADGWLVREGAGRSTRYRAVARAAPLPLHGEQRFVQRYAVAGLEEDRVWREIAAELPALPSNVGDIAHYAVTELVNNAIDHAAAASVDVVVALVDGALAVDIRDDGIGVFEHVRRALDLPDPYHAIEQLHKGKTTTMPDRHTGEGIFFVSKAVDVFELDSGELSWVIDNRIEDVAIIARPLMVGTRAAFSLAMDSIRTLRAVFDAYTDDFQFSRSKAVVRLFTRGVRFMSRSEAKRLLHGLDRFAEVILDFEQVAGVGQGFADEIFRVWSRGHPKVKLVPVSMCEPVAFMIERARAVNTADQ